MKKGFTCSAFDFLHPGHLLMLEEAKAQCDFLVVGLHTNPHIERSHKTKPFQTTLERFLQLKACRYVDEIYPYDTEEDLFNLLQIVRPDIRIIGIEYKDKDFTGKDLPIPVFYNERSHTYSSTLFRNRFNE